MSKRESDLEMGGPPSKMLKDEDSGGRAGRVRKKSAKVLEMEEFEQAEKKGPAGKSPVAKKVKTPKLPGLPVGVEEVTPLADKPSATKKTKPAKTLAAALTSTPVSTMVATKIPKVSFKLEPDLTSATSDGSLGNNVTNIRIAPGGKIETAIEGNQLDSPAVKKDSKSVMKFLLNSQSEGNVNVSATLPDTPSTGKKLAKKPKNVDIKSPKQKVKVKKTKPESVSTSEEMSQSESETFDTPTPSLKMKIISSSNPASALVSLGSPKFTDSPDQKQKKAKKVKKLKDKSPDVSGDLSDISPVFPGRSPGSDSDTKPSLKKTPKKPSKKKEKLIQDAISSISAAKQMPNLAALVSSQGALNMNPDTLSTETLQAMHKSQKPKKKMKSMSPILSGESLSDSQIKSDLSFEDDEAEDEVGLIIAETENKKKKTLIKKKVPSGKGKPSSPSKAKEDDKKLIKRAPTAYMLFCNTTRPEIVNENPGIEFATISKKLGEIWQGLSNKQKLEWRKKAQTQTKIKKGSTLISTGKITKDSQSVAKMSSHVVEAPQLSVNMAKSPRQNEESPQSPTNQNYSIEPIDVAAHLKLLGESLSIIGMRLQEHKGMIAVQGSLSVLLDSLLCACGPLLSLTHQVPGMDGCPPLVHAKTLDSVAYVMPGL